MTDLIEAPVAATTPSAAVPALLDRCETAARDGLASVREDALAVLRLSDADTIAAIAAAGRIRRATFANTVKMNFLVNLKSGPVPRGLQLLLAAPGLRGRRS